VGVGSHREWGVTESQKFCQVCRHSKKVGNPCFSALLSGHSLNVVVSSQWVLNPVM
jgi:hypothetical protein